MNDSINPKKSNPGQDFVMDRTCKNCGYYKKLPDKIITYENVNFWSFLPWVERKVTIKRYSHKQEWCLRFGKDGSSASFERHGLHYVDSSWDTNGNCGEKGSYWIAKT